jgi:3-oxoacyl-[acyl-carrier protein] reductase
MSDLTTDREHVVVTGGAGGIGEGIATVLARSGAAVTLVDYREDALRTVATRIADAVPGAHVDHVVADLTSPTEPGQAIETAWRRAGAVDLVVNGAGIYPSTPLLELDAQIWDAIQDVNVRSAVLTTVAFAKLAKAAGRKGNVVNITSGAALRARPAAAPYSTSKAALEMWTKASALELGPIGIRVNAVSPGFVAIESPVNPYEERYRQGADQNPLRRDGTPEDIGEAVRWISSPAAGWVTGTVIRVDGGSSTGTTTLPRSWPVMSLGIHGEVSSADD